MKVLIIVAQQGYQDHEYGVPKQILESAGIEVITASKYTGPCTGGLGGNTKAKLSLSEVETTEFDAIIFAGGPGAIKYQHDSEAHIIAKDAVENDKILAAICIAPTILAYAGVLDGRKATVWNQDGQQQNVLTNNGAEFTNESVTVDGKKITANGPPAAQEFGEKILEMLQK